MAKDKKTFERQVERINEALKSHETIFRSLLVVCALGLSTINSFSDMDLIVNNRHSTTLPLLNATLSSKAFLWFMPLFITTIYIYYILLTDNCEKLYIQAASDKRNITDGKEKQTEARNAIEELDIQAIVPAEIADTTAREDNNETIYDYTFTSTADCFRHFCDNLKQNNLSFWSQDGIKASVYWALLFAIQPATQLLIILICLRKHDFWLTFFQLLITSPTLFSAMYIFCKQLKTPFDARKSEPKLHPYIIAVNLFILFFGVQINESSTIIGTILFSAMISIALCGFKIYEVVIPNFAPLKLSLITSTISMSLFLSVFIFSSANARIERIILNEDKKLFPLSQRIQIASYLNDLNCNPFLDLRNAIISTPPDSWTGEPKDEIKQMRVTKGADLQQVDLRGADLESAFLGKSNLRGADLRGAYLRNANLIMADLRGAKLENAYIRLVNFKNADLRDVTFGKKVFIEDYDNPTYLKGPKFEGARFDWQKILKQPNLFPVCLIRDPDSTLDSNKLANEQNNEDVTYYTVNLPLAYFGFETEKDWITFQTTSVEVGDKLKRLNFPALTDIELRTAKINRKIVFPHAFSMKGAFFDNFEMTNVEFNKTYLFNSSFKSAKLHQVQFKDCDLRKADFTGADLECTDFTGSNLTGAIFEKCNNIEFATFPPEFSYF